jgi:antitoxin (DNA-binding transcriptional repressor) of toxin-antitoxin stability system
MKVVTIDLQELNQNPARIVARVQAGETLLFMDRGQPILRMTSEFEESDVLRRLVAEGRATPPTEHGMPDLMPDLLPEVRSLSDLLLAERERER